MIFCLPSNCRFRYISTELTQKELEMFVTFACTGILRVQVEAKDNKLMDKALIEAFEAMGVNLLKLNLSTHTTESQVDFKPKIQQVQRQPIVMLETKPVVVVKSEPDQDLNKIQVLPDLSLSVVSKESATNGGGRRKRKAAQHADIKMSLDDLTVR